MTSNHATGHAAEQVAAEYLGRLKFNIIQINWKTRYCEIDIVAIKKHVVYFVEVKSRKSTTQGTGLDYITDKKLQQMLFAAKMWIQAYDWRNDYRLAALAIDDEMITFVEL